MSKKPYSWVAGAVLEEHSRRKHKVIAEYVARYLTVRCQLPQQSRFRLAIVDGFAGGGQYKFMAVVRLGFRSPFSWPKYVEMAQPKALAASVAVA